MEYRTERIMKGLVFLFFGFLMFAIIMFWLLPSETSEIITRYKEEIVLDRTFFKYGILSMVAFFLIIQGVFFILDI